MPYYMSILESFGRASLWLFMIKGALSGGVTDCRETAMP
jgi:hypothetical protein